MALWVEANVGAGDRCKLEGADNLRADRQQTRRFNSQGLFAADEDTALRKLNFRALCGRGFEQ
jgi:hypothetical protein